MKKNMGISLDKGAAKIKTTVPSTSSADGRAVVSFPNHVGGLDGKALAEHFRKTAVADETKGREPADIADGAEATRSLKGEILASQLANYFAGFAKGRKETQHTDETDKASLAERAALVTANGNN